MIEKLMQSGRGELSQRVSKGAPIVLSSRIRLARNLIDCPFPDRASSAQRRDVLSRCERQISSTERLRKHEFFEVEKLSDLEKQVLVERHLVSRELCEARGGAGVVISPDESCSVMINEEDHLRIQFLRNGFNLKTLWRTVDAFDTALEESLDFAFSPEFGYLTACPTNLGTGLRASVMMHLPGLVIASQMERVIRAVNQLGITVRGYLGEGSEATGHVFQISNQQTLGETEEAILERLGNVLKTVREHEQNAREKFLEEKRSQLLDKIGRAAGLLCNAHVISSNESMNLLSLARLAVDFELLPEDCRASIDRLFIECQPGHIQYAADTGIAPEDRDVLRADALREQFGKLPALDFDKV